MKKTQLIALLLACSFAVSTHAETEQVQDAAGSGQSDVQSEHEAQDQPPAPPANNLGQQMPGGPPTVVYPRPEDVIDDTVNDIQDLQLTPEQVKKLKQVWLDREKAKATPYADPPKPVTRTLPINLDPGISPPVLRLSMGQLTSIVFSDNGGQPWIIQKVALNRDVFNDGKSDNGQSGQAAANSEPTNILTLTPERAAAYGNVTVTLKGLATPIIMILTTAQTEVDMRIDAKVPGRNPDTVATINVMSMPRIDDTLTAFLDGVPPAGAKRLNVTGLDGVSAWLYKSNLYIRAKAQAQYPAYTHAEGSTSGVNVYKFAGMQNAVTFTTGGQAVTVFIEQGDLK